MATDKLRLSLDELRQQLKLLDSGDRQARSRIEGLIYDLETQLEDTESTERFQSVQQKLPDLVAQFEVEHPRITSILDQIMTTLSNMGI